MQPLGPDVVGQEGKVYKDDGALSSYTDIHQGRLWSLMEVTEGKDAAEYVFMFTGLFLLWAPNETIWFVLPAC